LPDRLYNEDAVTDSAKFHDSEVSFVNFKTLYHQWSDRPTGELQSTATGHFSTIQAFRPVNIQGDIVRDLEPLFRAFDFAFSEREIGGWGSVHLYLAKKRQVSDGR